MAVRPRPPLRRPARGRVVAGVAAGVAGHLGLPVRAVRIGFVAAAAALGAGLVAYGLLWALVPDEAGEAGAGNGGRPGPPRRPRFAVDGETGAWLLWGVALVTVGSGLLVERLGLGVPVQNLLPAALAVTGAVIVWGNLDVTVRSRWVAGATGGTARGGLRLVSGLALVVVGTLLVALTGTDAAAVRPAAVAALAVLAGVSLLLAPWGLRLWRGFEAERAARVRETERADIAAHLHDSVLQTLALIQRRSDDPAEVSRLARAQERELRGWLYGPPPATAGASVRAAVEEVLADVEDDHAVPVEVVVVGDRSLDARTEAVVLAVREATLNAVRHGRPPVRVYVEVAEESVEAFVSDRGDGFDPDDVPADRLGVRESVVGRMERAGGTARVRRPSAGGTEVVLSLPLGQGRPAPGTDQAVRPREETA